MMMGGMMFLGVLVLVLAAGSLLTMLVASIISVRRQRSWHAIARVIGVGIHCGSLLAMTGWVWSGRAAGGEAGPGSMVVAGAAMLGIAGTALFAAGYLGLVLATKPS